MLKILYNNNKRGCHGFDIELVALVASRECWCSRKTTGKKLNANAKKLFAIPTLKAAPLAVAA